MLAQSLPSITPRKAKVATKITHLSVRDIRFPTSRSLDGSDAMNAAPDYSATYVMLQTDAGDSWKATA